MYPWPTYERKGSHLSVSKKDERDDTNHDEDEKVLFIVFIQFPTLTKLFFSYIVRGIQPHSLGFSSFLLLLLIRNLLYNSLSIL